MNELELIEKQIKENIKNLICNDKLDEASNLINEYLEVKTCDMEMHSMKAVVLIMQKKINEAEEVIRLSLEIDDKNADLNYNLAYIYEQRGEFNNAFKYYKKALEKSNNEKMKIDIIKIMKNILRENKISFVEEKKKIVFFVMAGMDSFLDNIILGLSDEYETKKIIVTEYKQIDEGMKWADICWFEWCDELIIYGSGLDVARKKKVICRLHSYEAFLDYPEKVKWTNVDNIIFDVAHIRDVVLSSVHIDNEKISLIPVGVNTKKYEFKNRSNGYNVAYVGYINYKKGPMFLIQLINELVKKDSRYKLYIGGTFQDKRDVLYFEQMIKELRLENNLILEGWVDDVNKWLESKDYIVSTSLLEGQHLSVMEGMCKGIKPIIHNFVGAKQVYNEKYVWNTFDEAVEMIREKEYNSAEYRKYIEDNYSNEQQLIKIKSLINKISPNNKNEIQLMKEEKLVTVGIINYNYSNYLDKAIQSVLNQTYKNIEIIIIDDCSVDGSIEKIKQYEQRYTNIRGIFHKTNSGSAVLGFRETISEAKGEYFMILSADDYLSTEMSIYDFLTELVNHSELDYVYSNLNIVDINGVYKNAWEYKQYRPEEIVQYTFNKYGSGIMPMTAGIYKTDFYRKNNINWYDDKDNIVAGDTLNSLINIKYNFKCKHIDKGLISYRHHDKNMTYDLFNRIKSIISVVEYIINNFNEEVYLTEIPWNEFNNFNKRQAKKMYVIGKYYMNVLEYYNNNVFKIWNDSEIEIKSEEIKSYIKPLALKVKEYLERCLEYSDEYSIDIKIMNEYLQQILE